MTELSPAYETAMDRLPSKAINLARRVLQLTNDGNGRYTLELVVSDDRWLLIVDGGPKVEDLGDC